MKVSGIFVEMTSNDTVWSTLNFEPLILCIVLPFTSRQPWKFRSTTLLNKCARNLQTLWKENFEVGNNSLRELLVSTRSLNILSGDAVRRMLHSVPRGAVQDQPHEEEGFDLTTEKDRTKQLVTRNGDYRMILFQCELCHFRNMNGCNPSNTREDIMLIRTVRRANVDAFWLREHGTVEGTRREIRKIVAVRNRLGLENVFPVMGPFPLSDTQGMGIAVSILLRSLDKNRSQNTL